MKIFACLKIVPDSSQKPKPNAAGTGLDEADLKFVVNPYDEFAVEQAVLIKEAVAGTTVTLVCMTEKDAQKEIRALLATGADDAVVLKETTPGRDALGAAKALAAYFKSQSFDIIFFGKQGIDNDQHATGQMVATLLDVPCVTAIDSWNLDGQTATVSRAIEGGKEEVQVKLPAVFTTDKGLNKPRLAKLKDIMAAKKKPIADAAAEAIAPVVTQVKLETPPARSAGKILGEGPDAVPALVKALRDEAKVL